MGISIRMRAFLSAAVLCLLSSPALSTIAISTAALSIPAISLAGVSVSSSVVAGTLGAISLLGAVKGGALLAQAKKRGRRAAQSIDADNVLFISILKLEEEKCVRRFVCEVATGHLNAPEYNSVISALLEANLELRLIPPSLCTARPSSLAPDTRAWSSASSSTPAPRPEPTATPP